MADETESSPELTAYYANRRLLWRNVAAIALLNVSWSMCFTVVAPLMTLRLNSKEVGFKEGAIGLLGSVTSSWAFMRNLYAGTLLYVSGVIIEKSGGNYHTAFILGIIMSTAGLALCFVYRYLKVGRLARVALAPTAGQDGPLPQAASAGPACATVEAEVT